MNTDRRCNFCVFYAIIFPALEKKPPLISNSGRARLEMDWADVFALCCWNHFNIEIFLTFRADLMIQDYL